MKKKVVITGAGSGLGKHAAIALAKRGHKVYATTKLESQAISLNNLAKEEMLSIESFKLDITLERDRKLLNDIEFDVLINNAAIGDSGSASETIIDRFKNTFEVNVFSNIRITQIALKKFIENKKGRVIFISSLLGRIPMKFLSPYSATKFAIESFASSLRSEMKELDGCDIGVSIIEPGAYKTGFNTKMLNKKYSWMKEYSYFRYNIDKIKQREEKIFKALEHKNFRSIISKYILAVESKHVKHRYTAPKLQAFFVQIARIFYK